MRKTLLLALLTGLVLQTLTAQTLRIIAPHTTDPNIDANSNAHYVYINTNITALNKLVVFFPGTGAAPSAYTLFLKEAANLGYHTIGLDYPNPVTINSVCSSSTDTACFTSARLEVLDGQDRNPNIQVDTANCINNRLLRLLKYLDSHYPAEGWNQYYNGNSTINWSKIVVSGHSQGGGHAGIISKYYTVDRVVMFDASDWMVPQNKPANWITRNGFTPKNRYWGFTHTNDELITFSTLQVPTWQGYDMYAFGNTINVDTVSAPYHQSHTLTTLATPAASGSTQYHGACAVSFYTPKDGLGNPVFAPVWDYLLISPATTGVANVGNINDITYSIYPNPVSQTINLHLPYSSEISVVNTLGQVVLLKTAGNGEVIIDVSRLTQGIYYVHISNARNSITKMLMKE